MNRPVAVGLIAALLLLAPLEWALGEAGRFRLGCYLADSGSSFGCRSALISGPVRPRS